MTLQEKIIGPELAQSKTAKTGRLSKTHQDYWKSRLERRSYLWEGRETLIRDWHVRIYFQGRREWWNLATDNKTAAAIKAKDIYVSLQAQGWDATLKKFKSNETAVPGNKLTVGQYLQAVRDTGKLRLRTFLNYQNCLRTIIAGVFGVKDQPGKYDYKTGGSRKWQERIGGIRLERVTPDRISAWRDRFLERAGESPAAIASARRTANSYVRCARSLFSRKGKDGKQGLLDEVQKKLKGAEVPSRLPFEGVSLFEAGSMKYVSKMNVQTFIAAAKAELKSAKPEVYKVFLLGLFAGMRKAEIDLAEWRMVDWGKAVITLQETDFLHLKSEDSAREITIDQEVIAELRAFKPASQSPFIIASDRPPRNDSARPYYRCDPVFERLNEWLRSKGVTANKPLHELRKEIGAQIAAEHGIYAASRFLGHSDITTTARHYADRPKRISVGLGKFLNTEIRVSDDGSEAVA